MNDIRAHFQTFENVNQPLSHRDWLTGDEFLSSMTEGLDVERESLCGIPDSRVEQGWEVQRADVGDAAAGEIWATTGATNPRLVVIRARDIMTPQGWLFEVLPVSFQHQFAGSFDYLIDRESSPLGVGFMVEVHLPIFVLDRSLAGRVGRLSGQQWDDTKMLILASLGLLRGDANRDAREQVRWITQGHPITRQDDLRVSFREHERASVSYLVDPAEAALAQMEPEETTSVVVAAFVALTKRAQDELRESFGNLRKLTEQVAERVAQTAEAWEIAFAAMAPPPVVLRGAEGDENAAAMEDAQLRFSQEEGMRVYPREGEPPAVPGCWFCVLPTATGYYLQILVDSPRIPLDLGALEVDEEPIFVANVFPSTPDMRAGFVRRLPVLPERTTEIAIPIRRDSQTDTVAFRLEPFPLQENE